MHKTYCFDFEATRQSRRSIQRTLNFMHELDQFAANFSFGIPGQGLLDSLLQGLLDGNANGELMMGKLLAEAERTQADGHVMTHEEGFKFMMLIIVTSLHFAVHALQAESSDDAFDHFSDARYLRGVADGILFKGTDALVRADLARVGAKARNAETRDIRTHVEAWYAEHGIKFKSVDAAAMAATKEAPISFTTARKWISEYKRNKKLQ
jgi:hypothetical protein